MIFHYSLQPKDIFSSLYLSTLGKQKNPHHHQYLKVTHILPPMECSSVSVFPYIHPTEASYTSSLLSLIKSYILHWILHSNTKHAFFELKMNADVISHCILPKKWNTLNKRTIVIQRSTNCSQYSQISKDLPVVPSNTVLLQLSRTNWIRFQLRIDLPPILLPIQPHSPTEMHFIPVDPETNQWRWTLLLIRIHL